MITKEYRHNTEFHGTDLNKSYVKAGFVSVAASLLVLLSATEPQPFDLTTTAFAQDSDSTRRNPSALLSLPGAATTMTNGLNSTLVDFSSNIEQIRGHLNAAVMNKEAGNNTLAKAHTLHPIAEIYSTIEPQITNANTTLNETLSANLNQLSQMVNTSLAEEFDSQSKKISGLLNQTIKQVIPSATADNSTFKLGVVSNLLSIAGKEYGEAVENGLIKEIVEYQDGQAFITRAENVFMQASSTIPQEMDPEVQETKQFFSDINNSIQNKSSPEVVDKSIEAAIHEISEITGISKESLGGQTGGTESGEIISEIRSLLNQTVEAYRQQNYAEAEALATTAYLDNFEFIEAPLAEKDEALMENTEVMLREQLRQLIQNKVSLEELQQHIDKIKLNLDQAEKLIG
jgi:hypothetical protein